MLLFVVGYICGIAFALVMQSCKGEKVSKDGYQPVHKSVNNVTPPNTGSNVKEYI